jgi:hypothetical protein
MHIDIERLILIVTGAHLRAEAADRPIAYALGDLIGSLLNRRGIAHTPENPRVLVCSDLWYLNNDPLRSRPTISVGPPGTNALSAFLADKLPSAFAIEGVLLVQADPGFGELVASCWGRDTPATAAAVDAFTSRYLDDFMAAATRGWE